MITLIGFRWKHSNVLSREVLIVHILLGNLKSTSKHMFACRSSLHRLKTTFRVYTKKPFSMKSSVLVIQYGGHTSSHFEQSR